jgi:hypothetical protein
MTILQSLYLVGIVSTLQKLLNVTLYELNEHFLVALDVQFL